MKLGLFIREYSCKNKEVIDVPVYSVTNSEGFCKDYFNKDVSSKEKSNYKLVPFGYFAYNPSRINVGSVDCQLKEKLVQVSPLYNVFKCSDDILNRYLLYYLKSNACNSLINAKTNGSVRANLKIKVLDEFDINVPSIERQQKIINELDNVITQINRSNSQLHSLDELIKSRFIEMFGDKEKNALFIDCIEKMTKGPFGSAVKKDLYVPESTDAYKVYIQVNCIQKNEKLGDYYISKEYFDTKMKSFEVKANDYLITCDGTLGKYIRLGDNPRKGIISASLLRLHLNEKVILPDYFEAIWDNYLLEKLKGQVRNGCLTHLPSAKVIGNEKIYLPPMEDQVKFSSLKKQIDKSKFSVQKEIELYQELLDKKMDEYFG